ncbi:uncharacterized protein LOC106081818 [Stomoxys calcitrans]|uniref:uncharacterized protein LOC106081818 n=1 Tax=Stomoxys calcitrans TaxID=35570 RepID=UPI0027E3422D|nr:uncharacterized protein LOC106081818 [Stomoxys calcitrans]
MRAFIVLCVVAVAYADKLGYNYHPVGHSSSGLSFAPGSGSQSGGVAAGNGPSSFGAGSSNGPSSFDSQGSSESPSFEPQGEIEKQFITYTADDEEFMDPEATNQFANSVKQGLRVVFVKGPDNRALEEAALALAKSAAEQHTDIYVLNKQADLAALANKLNSENSSANNKPDVHFVKYRTPEDAVNAQKAIQGQYDALGGKSENIDGGVASSLNFASQAPFARQSASAPGASYLPASVFRH